MLVDQLLVDRANDVDVDLSRVEIQQRHTELMRSSDGDGAGVRQVLVDEVRHERQFRLFRSIGRLEELLFRDQPVLDQPPGQACKIGLRCRCYHRGFRHPFES